MDFIKNKCPICMKYFCCSAHRADHEVKNHAETNPKLKQDFLVHLFQKRAKTILLKSQNQQANNFKEKEDNYINEKLSNKPMVRNSKASVKRVYREMDRRILSTSVTVQETRRILVPVHRLSNNNPQSDKDQLKANHQLKTAERPQSALLYNGERVKTSTPILENLPNEEPSASNWNYISPASSISYYGTPNMAVDGNSEGQPLFRPQSSKTLLTPLRSIMAKNTKYQSPSPNLNLSTKGRRVTFSFSSSRVSSANSSPLESVQEVEIHEEIQDENREVVEPSPSVNNFSKRDIITGDNNYVLEVTSMVNSCVHTSELRERNITNIQGFTEDSLVSVKGGLFSCVTNMFCSAIPLFKGPEGRNRSKRSRSPEREVENVVVKSPLPKRPCYPWDLRLNPIRARKPISQP